MAKHTLRIDFDDETGEVACVHRCAVEVGGHTVVHSRDVPLGNAAATLKAVVEKNRDLLEGEAKVAAARHVEALRGRGGATKNLVVGGTLDGITGT